MYEAISAHWVPVLVCVWVLCGIFASVGARQRGRSELGWLIVGFTCGVFALLVFAMPYLNGDGTMSLSKDQRRSLPKGTPLWVSFVSFGAIASVVLVTVVPNWDGHYAELQDTAIGAFEYLKSFNLLQYW